MFETLGVQRPERRNVAVFANVSPKSSGYRANLSALNQQGFVSYPSGDTVTLTEKGRDCSQAQNIRTLEELHAAWLRRFNNPQAAILRVLIGAYPATMKRKDLAGYVNVSPLSSGYRANLSTLVSFGVATYPTGDTIRATALLFPNSLMK